MKILVISRSPWRKDNSFGNTYSNIFGSMKNIQIANLYLADGLPDANNSNVVAYYRISEKEMTKSVLKKRCKKNQVGEHITDEMLTGSLDTAQTFEKSLTIMKKKRWTIFYIAREWVWKLGQANYSRILQFAEEFQPDLIFIPLYYAQYVSNMARYLKKHLKVPMVAEAAIDVYSMKQLSFSPFFWLNRLCVRRTIRKTVKQLEKLYVISDKMKHDYQKMLKINCDILYKAPDFKRCQYPYEENSTSLRFLYTGNIGDGRWKSLSLLGKALRENQLGELFIYTATPITPAMKKELAHCNTCSPVSADKVIELQNQADVLVHAESFDIKNKLKVRYSISTKVMDYISAQRCILAIGPSDVASVEYLKEKDLALIATTKKAIETIIRDMAQDRSCLKKYAIKNANYIKMLRVEKTLQENLYDDFVML